MLAKLEEKEDEKHQEEVLKHGLKETGRLLGGRLVSIDFQNVSMAPDGKTLYIDDPASPYDGMLIED